MTDAVLRFLVELKDEGLTKLEQGLLGVGKALTTMSAQTAKAGAGVETSLTRIAAAEKNAAQRSVANTAARQRALKANAAEYRALAATYQHGSQEQVAALLLAEKAEQRLARENAVATGKIKRNYIEAGAAAGLFERDVNKAIRGAISSSGLLSRGRTALALGSTAFLGGASVGLIARSIYNESTKAESVQDRLQAQLKATGISWAAFGDDIEKVVAKESKFAAIDDEDVKSALTENIRATGSLRASYKLLGLEEDIAAGKHIALSTAAGIVSRVYAGSLGILKRYGIVLGSDVKTPLEALIALQDKFAGQAERAGNSTAGAFEKTQNAFRNFEEGVGRGALPVITAELNKLTGAVDNPSLENAGERVGHAIATNVGGAIDKVVTEVRDHWPEIQQDFHAAEHVLEDSAHAAEDLAGALRDIASIVPGKDSLITLLIEGALLKKGLNKIGLGAATNKAGKSGIQAILKKIGIGTAAGGAAEGAGAATATEAGLLSNPITFLAGLGLFGYLQSRKPGATGGTPLDLPPTFNGSQFSTAPLFKNGKVTPATGFGPPLVQLANDATKATDKATGSAIDMEAQYRRLRATAVGTWKDVADAIRANGGDLDADKKKLQDLLKTEQDTARQRVQLLDDAFSRVTDDVDQAFDAKTQQMLDSLSYRVDVVAKGIRESFTLKGDQLTPAERELNALEAIQQRQQLRQGITDARLALGQAVQLGDPQEIEDAQRQLDQAQLAQRQYGLQQRAKLERAAADKARAKAQQDLQSRRDLEKRNLDDTLEQLLQEAEKGKLAGGKLATEVLGELRKYGVDFKDAGDLLGSAFATQLNTDLQTSQDRANKVGDAFERIAKTKDGIKQLVAQVKELAKQLKKAQDAAEGTTIATRIVGGVPKPSLVVKPTPKHAAGGVVDGYGTGDTELAWLTPGELVLNARQQRGLAAQLGMRGATPDRLFAAIQRFAGGGTVRRRDLQRLLRQLGIDAVENVRDTLRIADLQHEHKNVPVSLFKDSTPVHIEDLVREPGLRGLSRDAKLALDARLASAQAHPVIAGLLGGKAPYTDPMLGPTANGGALPRIGSGELANIGESVINLTVELDGDVIARKTQRVLQRRAGR